MGWNAFPVFPGLLFTMMHDALGEHAGAGGCPPEVVRQAPSGFRDGPAPAPAASALPAGRRVDDSSRGVIAAAARAHRSAIVEPIDTAARCWTFPQRAGNFPTPACSDPDLPTLYIT